MTDASAIVYIMDNMTLGKLLLTFLLLATCLAVSYGGGNSLTDRITAGLLKICFYAFIFIFAAIVFNLWR